jgi:hypothetical protein
MLYWSVVTCQPSLISLKVYQHARRYSDVSFVWRTKGRSELLNCYPASQWRKWVVAQETSASVAVSTPEMKADFLSNSIHNITSLLPVLLETVLWELSSCEWDKDNYFWWFRKNAIRRLVSYTDFMQSSHWEERWSYENSQTRLEPGTFLIQVWRLNCWK